MALRDHDGMVDVTYYLVIECKIDSWPLPFHTLKHVNFGIFLAQVKLFSKHTGKTIEQIEADIRRPKYFSPSEAVEYGIIDKVFPFQEK